MSKALLIKSYKDLTTGTTGTWNELNMASSYIQGIKTGEMSEDTNADTIGSLISGVPTPWARAKLFKFALSTLNNPDPNIDASGLVEYYKILHSEWRGLIALLALYPDRIQFSDPIVMNTRGDDYDIASAFGRMLFNDKDIWSNPDDMQINPDVQPFIHLIYYRDHLVGGTSPLTGCFTSVNYTNLGRDASDISWYRNGKFEDPMQFLNPEQRQKLYLFVKNMNNNLETFEDKVNSHRDKEQRVDLEGFKGMLRVWEADIKQQTTSQLKEKGPIPCYEKLSCPFSILFQSDVPVYMKTDDFTFTYEKSTEDKCKEIGDIQNLLSKDSFVIGWVEDDDNQRQKLSGGPMYFLQVKDDISNSIYYFTIPLSENGIDIFKDRLSDILGYTQGGNTHMTATINDAGQLSVTLVVEIDGESVTLNAREYKIDWMTGINKVIMWPNFVSDKWNKYYLYSEFTAEAQQQFYPIFKYDGKILRDGNGEFFTPLYQLQPAETSPIDYTQLVKYPEGLSGDYPKYNIWSVDKPIEGLMAMVKLSGKYVRAGYLMMRHSVIADLTSIDMVSNATVGIDFGSNNTCVYYNDGRAVNPIKFENHRAVLVGLENKDERANASNNELLFFTNFPASNGQLKSWLHEHDSRYNQNTQSEEIAGGVPVNRPNVYVRTMDEYEIKTQAGILHYNMKWLDDSNGLEKKKAYLKSIWLQTCAYLYKNRISPQKIRWSHPGSMMVSDVNDYANIFSELQQVTPYGNQLSVNDVNEQLPTEAEAVCSFALSQDFGLTTENIFLGIDVGGTTSDILLLARDTANANRFSLYRESSVRLASGVFFNAIINSSAFRQALVNFHESPQRSVYISDIKDVKSDAKKAPYYLNNIFDQLKIQDDYRSFYSKIYSDAKFVFTIPAYVTGLLLFYSGMLIGNTIKKQGLDRIQCVDILAFGKGGRIFHWLRTVAPLPTTKYYATCLNAGVSIVIDKTLIVNYKDEIEVDNKAEVAKGLCDPKDFIKVNDNINTDICGEQGVRFTMSDGSQRILSVEDELTGEYFANDMNNLDFDQISNFTRFMDIFIDFVSRQTNIYPNADNDLRADLQNLPSRISANIVNRDLEYKKAKEKSRQSQNGEFHYHQPIIIAEGLCFLDTLIKKAFNK